jgi:DHA2 family multidrug resistance protein
VIRAAGAFSAVGLALQHSRQDHPPRLRIDSWRPYVGLIGVLLGSIMGTLGSRTTSFGLADLRGSLHAGFDEGAWITTSFGVGQMLVGVASPYLGAMFGARRVLLTGIVVFFLASLLAPLATNLTVFFLLLAIGGIGSGTFIPLTISFVIRSLPARLVITGIAVYAMNSELSQNVAASLEGWFADQWSWHWIFWQYCLALPMMFVAIWFGVPREPVNTALLTDFDWPGLGYASIGFAMLYAGLDQGNRLDWTSSGLVVVGLLAGGGLLTVAFLVREVTAPRPFLNLRLLLHGNLVLILLNLAAIRFIILSTAYIIPTYLQAVQNFRELQVGQVLLWIALPQFVIVLPLAMLLRRVDGRYVLAFGTALIGAACLMTAEITSVWATADFLPSQILQAIGQSFALTALTVLSVRSIVPVEALTVGCLLQLSRLFGGEIGTAFMQTFVRMREQIHSNLIGLHVSGGGALTSDRLVAYAAGLGTHLADADLAGVQARRLLATAVTGQASVLAYQDGFIAAAAGTVLCVLLVALMRPGRHSPF